MSIDTDQVLADIRAERSRQINKGWTREHDDGHDTHTLVRLAEEYAHKPGEGAEPGYYDRQRLIQSAALLVAAVEAMDRHGAA